MTFTAFRWEGRRPRGTAERNGTSDDENDRLRYFFFSLSFVVFLPQFRGAGRKKNGGKKNEDPPPPPDRSTLFDYLFGESMTSLKRARRRPGTFTRMHHNSSVEEGFFLFLFSFFFQTRFRRERGRENTSRGRRKKWKKELCCWILNQGDNTETLSVRLCETREKRTQN